MNLTLLNLIRCNRSYLSENDILKLLSSDLSSIHISTLKELARVINVPPSLKKSELITEITIKLHILETEPLKFTSLKQEANLSGIPADWFSYRDLKILLKYEPIEDAGSVYCFNVNDNSITRIMFVTDIGNYVRLKRLRECNEVDDWILHEAGSKSKEPLLYRLLFSDIVIVNDTNKDNKIVYTCPVKSEIGNILLTTVPNSISRKKLLHQYDEGIINAFRRSHNLDVDQDLMDTIALTEPNNDIKHYYISDNDKIGKILHETKENTLERYTAIHLLTTDPEDYCCIPQIEDNRPHKIRDYKTHELESLDTEILHSLLVKEGIFSDTDHIRNMSRDEILDSLIIASISPTFFMVTSNSQIINTTQTTTCLLTQLKDVTPCQLYGYGIRDGTGKFNYYERDELKAKFESEQDFIDPITNKTFDLNAIRRLLILSKNDLTEGVNEFRNTIRNIIRLQQNVSREERELVRIFNESEDFKNILHRLFESGLYMRRWDGNIEKFPLSRTDTEIEMDELELFSNVTNSLHKLEEEIEKLPEEYKGIIWNLKIKNYSNQGFISATDEIDGFTLQDRFQIVKRGDDISAPITSCIRLTSGWFMFTALYYHQLIYKSNIYGVRAHEIDYIS